MDNVINICYITDKNYFLPTLVSILSVAENCSESHINIYVICSDVSQKHIKILRNLKSKNISIIVKNVENPYTDLGEKHIYVSRTALLKFSVPNLFPNLDKILYLDSDILVCKDLENLYNIDLNNSYAAVVSDMEAVSEYKCHYKLELNNYFNSGVMLLNLQKIRKDNITQKFIELKSNEYQQQFMDQDVINRGFNNGVIFIEPKYNFMYSKLSQYSRESIAAYYDVSVEEIDMIYNSPCILHLTDYIKPWNNCFAPCFTNWFTYFLRIPALDLKILSICNILTGTLKYIIKEQVKSFNKTIEKIFMHILPIVINQSKMAKSIERSKNLSLNKKPREESIIISLTTFPERINELKFCLYSLFNQTFKADKIVLYLSEDEFTNREDDLPDEVLNFIKYGLEIRWCSGNLRSYKKLIYALKDYPDSIIVTVDDDLFYSKNLLAELYKSYKKNPDCISTHRAHRIVKNNKGNILPYDSWIKEIASREINYDNFLTSGAGVLFPPNCFNSEVFNTENIEKLCPYADDIWFWGMGVLNNRKVKIVKNPSYFRYINIEREKGLTKEKTLAEKNVGELYNDVQFKNFIKEYPLVKDRLMQVLKTKETNENILKKELPIISFRLNSRIVVKIFNKIFRLKRY